MKKDESLITKWKMHGIPEVAFEPKINLDKEWTGIDLSEVEQDLKELLGDLNICAS